MIGPIQTIVYSLAGAMALTSLGLQVFAPDPGPLTTLEVEGLDPGRYWWDFTVTPEAGGDPVPATAKVEVRE